MPPAAFGGALSVPVASGTRQTPPDMIVSHRNGVKKSKRSKKKANSVSTPDDASSGNSVLVAANEAERTVPEMVLSNENLTRKSKKGKTSKRKANSISDPGDPSLDNNLSVMENETRQNVLEMLSNEKEMREPKKGKKPKKKAGSVLNSIDASSGSNILVGAKKTKQTVPEVMLSNENQTKTSRNESNAISSQGDAPSGKSTLVVADETKLNGPEMVLSDVNETKKSKKRKRSKTRIRSVSSEGDVSSGNNLVVANETRQIVPEVMLSNENQTKTSRNEPTVISSQGDASSGKSVLVVADEAIINGTEMLSDVNETDKSKKRKRSKASDASLGKSALVVAGETKQNAPEMMLSDVKKSTKAKKSEKKKKRMERKQPSARRKLLILDLNGLLAHIVRLPVEQKPDFKWGRNAVYKRPFCDDFLKFCFKNFDVGVWTSRKSESVKGVIDRLMGYNRKRLRLCWYQCRCSITDFKTLDNKEKPIILKDFKKLSETKLGLKWKEGYYNASNTLLIDDSPYKALRNPPHTAIFPEPYTHDNADKDDFLGPNGELRLYLERLAAAENVQEFVKHNPFGQHPITSSSPHWEFYSEVINAPRARSWAEIRERRLASKKERLAAKALRASGQQQMEKQIGQPQQK